MRLPHVSAVLAAMTLSGCAGGLMPGEIDTRPKSRLLPYVECRPSDPSIVLVKSNRAAPGKYRQVRIGAQTKRVSVWDGYRMIFTTSSEQTPFANVKVEQSDPSKYAADKQVIAEQMQSMVKDGVVPIETNANGFPIKGVEELLPRIGDINAMETIFSDFDSVVVTIYFLATRTSDPRFAGGDEHRRRRDEFVNDFTRCLKAVQNSGRL